MILPMEICSPPFSQGVWWGSIEPLSLQPLQLDKGKIASPSGLRIVKMAIATDLFLTKLIDNQSKVVRSAQDIVREGNWFFKRVDTYTEASPFAVLDGQTLTLPIPLEDTGQTAGRLLNFSYDYDNQLFRPTVAGEAFIAEVKLRVKPTSSNFGHMDLILEIPDYPFNPINGDTLSFSQGMNEPHFFSANFLPFVSEEMAQDGVRLLVHARGVDVEIYNYNFMFVRLHSNKG
jgi:hypothetical protein